MNLSAIGIGAGAVAATTVGFGGTKILDGVAARNPTGSAADGPAAGLLVASGLGSAGLAGGGMFALSRGNLALGAGLLGAGIGGMVGTIGAGIAFTARHGVGVDTAVRNTFNAYNRDFNDVLDLDTRWRAPENVRQESHRHEDSNGNVYYTYSYHTIDRLTHAADVDRNDKVTKGEIRDVYASYDADGDGRLKGQELKRMEREVGERSYYGHWW